MDDSNDERPDRSVQRRRLHDRVDVDLRWHSPAEIGSANLRADVEGRMDEVRQRARTFAHYLIDVVPTGRELSRALTAVEDACMQSVAALARHPDELP